MTKQEALEELDSLCIPRDGEQDRLVDAFEMAYNALEERKTSKWIDTKQITLFTYNHIFRCSLCGCEVEGNGDNYCKSCGAKMEDGE